MLTSFWATQACTIPAAVFDSVHNSYPTSRDAILILCTCGFSFSFYFNHSGLLVCSAFAIWSDGLDSIEVFCREVSQPVWPNSTLFADSIIIINKKFLLNANSSSFTSALLIHQAFVNPHQFISCRQDSVNNFCFHWSIT